MKLFYKVIYLRWHNMYVFKAWVFKFMICYIKWEAKFERCFFETEYLILTIYWQVSNYDFFITRMDPPPIR